MGASDSQPIVPPRATGQLLWKAVKDGDVNKVRGLLRSPDAPTFVDWVHPDQGTTPLMLASVTGKHKIVPVLIDAGASLDLQQSRTGQTALHLAASKNRVGVVEKLLLAKCDPHVWNVDGWTAMDVARMEQHREVCNTFVRLFVTAKGWLYIKKGRSMLTRWKRRWCMLFESSSDHSSLELAIFHHPDEVKPHKVLFLTPHESAVSPVTRARHSRKHTFQFTSTATFQRYHKDSFSRSLHVRGRRGIPVYSASGFRFATETEEGRDRWVELVGPLAFTPSAPTVLALPMAQPQEDIILVPEDVELRQLQAPCVDDCAPSAPVLDEPEMLTDGPEEGNNNECVVCMDMPRAAVCVPCGHLAGCFKCLTELKGKNGCPICRAPITTVVRVYTC